MNIADFLQNEGNKRGFSFEVLPPLKGNGTAALFRTIDSLKDYAPRFINITTHHSEYVYKELENGLLSRQRVRRRPGTVAIAVPSRTSTIFLSFRTSFAVASPRKTLSTNCSTSSFWASAISWYFAVIRPRMIECSPLPKMVMRMQPTF